MSRAAEGGEWRRRGCQSCPSAALRAPLEAARLLSLSASGAEYRSPRRRGDHTIRHGRCGCRVGVAWLLILSPHTRGSVSQAIWLPHFHRWRGAIGCIGGNECQRAASEAAELPFRSSWALRAPNGSVQLPVCLSHTLKASSGAAGRPPHAPVARESQIEAIWREAVSTGALKAQSEAAWLPLYKSHELGAPRVAA